MDSWPIQEALNKALHIYRTSMRLFIISRLKQIRGRYLEDIVIDSFGGSSSRPEAILQSDRPIESTIDINDFPHLVNKNWDDAFEAPLKDDKTFRNQLWLIVECRNEYWAHPAEGDAEIERTRVHLYLIADVLGKINRPDKQREVEVIRDELFDNTVKAKYEKETNEKLSQQKAEIEKLLGQLNSTSKQLETLRAEHSTCEENFTKISDQLAAAESERDEYEKRFETKSSELETVELERDDYQERLEVKSKELQDVEAEWNASEERFVEKLSELAAAQTQKDNYREQLAAMQGLFTTATLDKPEIRSIFPAFDTDSPVRILDRILDRRGTDKLDYLSKLLEQKQPAIIYVQSEEKVEQLLKSLPEKASVMKKHDENTSDAEEKEILGKLEKGELIAIVSSSTVSTLSESHCIEHFVFCHLVPDLNTFFERCRPIFTSRKSTYLHLIYESKQDLEELAEKYPNEETLRKLYAKVIEHTPLGKDINPKVLYDELCKEKELNMTKREIERGLTIFKESGFLEENEAGIKRLGSPKRKLKGSTYRRGKEQREAVESSPRFQYEQSIEQIGEEILRKVGIDSEKGMSAFINILRQRAAKSTNDTDTPQHLKNSGAIEGKQQGRPVRYGLTVQGETTEAADAAGSPDAVQAPPPSDSDDSGEAPPQKTAMQEVLDIIGGDGTETAQEPPREENPLLTNLVVRSFDPGLSPQAKSVKENLQDGKLRIQTVENAISETDDAIEDLSPEDPKVVDLKQKSKFLKEGLHAYIQDALPNDAGIIEDRLYFKSTVNTGAWFALSNFYKSVMTFGGKTYATLEHLFQSKKFEGSNIKVPLRERNMTRSVDLSEAIRRAAAPKVAYDFAQHNWNNLSPQAREAWHERSESVMEAAVIAKFSNPMIHNFDGREMTLAEVLLETHDLELIHLEHSDFVPVWGVKHTAHGDVGQNVLGKILMKLRDKLRKEQLVAPEQASEITNHTDTTWRIHEPELTYPLSEDEENAKDSQKKYDLAMQFAQKHGFSALEQGIAELMRDRDDPSYNFTEDETNMLGAFQDALKDFQAQSAQSTEVFKKDDEVSDEVGETAHTPKLPRANAKVTAEQVKEIRARSAAGESYSQLAKEFSLTPTSIRSIVLRNTWKHVE